MTRAAACVLGMLAIAPVGLTAAPDAVPVVPNPTAEEIARARELVGLLGSEAYRDRDRASRDLRRMGRLALPALTEALQSTSDPEVKARCEELLPGAEAEDMAMRVAAFLSDTAGVHTHDLPGWEPFREAAGDEPSARHLFAELLKNPQNHELLLAAQSQSDRLKRSLAARRQHILQQARTPVVIQNAQVRQVIRQGTPELPDMALLLFAESLVPDTAVPVGVPGAIQSPIVNFLYQPALKDAVAGRGDFGPPFRRLVLRWIDTREGPAGTANALQASINLHLGPAAINRQAARALNAEGAMLHTKVYALAQLAKHNGKDYLAEMTRFFDDDAVFSREVQPPGVLPGAEKGDEIQVRDVALAMAAILTGQDPKDYGMERKNPTDPNLFVPTAFLFRSDEKATVDEKRADAIRQWRKWEASQPGANP